MLVDKSLFAQRGKQAMVDAPDAVVVESRQNLQKQECISQKGLVKGIGKGKGKFVPPPPANCREAREKSVLESAARSESARLSREAARAAKPKERKDNLYSDLHDPFNLRERFCLTQQTLFSEALSEIMAGKKETCWSWYIFPVPPLVDENGLEEASPTTRKYALRDGPDKLVGENAARAFLQFKEIEGVNLRANYIIMMNAVSEKLEAGIRPARLVGALDHPKLQSSLELFARASGDGFDPEVHTVCVRGLDALKLYEQSEG